MSQNMMAAISCHSPPDSRLFAPFVIDTASAPEKLVWLSFSAISRRTRCRRVHRQCWRVQFAPHLIYIHADGGRARDILTTVEGGNQFAST